MNTVNIEIFVDIEYEMTNLANNRKFKFKKTTISIDNKVIELNDMHINKVSTYFPYHGYEATLKLIKTCTGVEEKKDVLLHPVVLNRLLNFLVLGEPNEKYPTYSCTDFMNELLLGRETRPLNVYTDGNFITSPQPARYFANDGVLLVRKDGGVVHCALYIGHDLYLYKFGINGPIIITTYDQMTKAYTDELHGPLRSVKAIPKNDILTAYHNGVQLENISSDTLYRISKYLCSADQINLASTNKALRYKMSSPGSQ